MEGGPSLCYWLSNFLKATWSRIPLLRLSRRIDHTTNESKHVPKPGPPKSISPRLVVGKEHADRENSLMRRLGLDLQVLDSKSEWIFA
jgi:hypothetical protein